jgi:hypothetical protein
MSTTDEMERTVAFRASARFPSPERLAAGRERLLAAMAQQPVTGRAVAGRGAASVAPLRRRWRRPALAGGLAAAVAAGAAAALVVTGGPAAMPRQHEATGHARTVVTAAWTVREDADGTVTIYLRQYADPAGLQRTLREDGVNAIVRQIPKVTRTIGKSKWVYDACEYAATNDAPSAVQEAVVGDAIYYSAKLGLNHVIHPDAMPPGSALFLTFSNLTFDRGKKGLEGHRPVVLNNDTLPACVPYSPPASFFRA